MKRWTSFHGVLALLVTVLLACGGATNDRPGSGGGSATQTSAGGTAAGGTAGGSQVGGTGGGVALATMVPPWQLVDLQPLSPRANQSYGLAAFQGRPVVAVLIEGF